MKKLFICGLSIALVAGATSCGKSSKGKMANEWKVTEFTWSSTDTDNSETNAQTISGTETAITITSTNTPSGGTATTSTQSGTISENSYTINKDGSWTSTLTAQIVDSQTGYTITSDINIVNSGTWDFLGGVGEFKKNERVVFNTTSEVETSSTTVAISGGATTTDVSSSTNTYADGENSMVYTVVESKGKELQLSADGNNSSSNTNTPSGGSATTTNYSSTSANSMTMMQK